MGNYIIDKSFQLVRTNTELTTNYKICVDQNLNLYLESFNSNKQLSDDKYKHYFISKDSYLEDKLLLFYNGLPANIAFESKKSSDKDIVYNNYVSQFDDLYWSGVKKVEENKFYKEEFEYFAPLYLKYKDLPSNFIIMRVDNPGVYELNSFDYNITKTDKDNFRDEIISKWKCIKNFDLTKRTSLGKWLDDNFISNERFPDTPFEFDSENTSFSRWYGIDYKSGSFTEKSQFISDKIWYEQPHFRFEKYITEGYKRNEIIFPNILNMNYLFDDNPASPFKLNKYTINRYLGFYVDLEKIDVLTSYKQYDILPNISIVNNVFKEIGSVSGSTSPFFQTDEEWDDNEDYYIYAIDNLFKVERVKTNNGYSYNILSNYDLNISDVTKNKECDLVFVEGNNYEYTNKISMRNSNLELDKIITPDGIKYLYSDLYLINIDNNFHVIKYDDINDEYYIQSDYGFETDNIKLRYWIENKSKATEVLIHDNINHTKPLIYEIYKVKFRDIKDFDYNYIDTGFADFDFDKKDTYVETTEQKLYCVEYRDATIDTVFKQYEAPSLNEGKLIIASSEYVADDELYELNKDGLTDIWEKNPSIVKWNYSGSISHADYPYKLNNSNKVGFTFNRTTDIYSNLPNIVTKTNDFYYRIGNFISGSTDGTSYNHKYFDTQSLSIETDMLSEDGEVTSFDLDLYLKSDFDYFDYFFNSTRYINDDKDYIESQYYSIFTNGNKFNSSTTLFKGINYYVQKIDDIVRNDLHEITDYLFNNDDFNQYKFSIIANYNTSGYTGTTYDDLTVLRRYPHNVKYSGILEQDSINLFYNEKYKNILIILNLRGVVKDTTININNLSNFNKFVIYDGSGVQPAIDINTHLSIARNFITKINNNEINYYYIDSFGETGSTFDNNLENISSWNKDFSPIKINTIDYKLLSLKKNSFSVAALKGPKTNIYDKFKNDFTESIYDESFIKDPLGRIITINEKELKPRPQYHGENIIYDKKIFRYNGPYEPIFKNISLFEKSKYYVVDGSQFLKKKCGKDFEEIVYQVNAPTWIFPEYSLDLCDNIYSTANFDFQSSNQTILSNYLIIKDFGFNITNSAIIKGVKVYVKKHAEVNNIYSQLFDNELYITLNNNNISDNYAITGTSWTTTSTMCEYGDYNNVWNISGLTWDMINDSTFGVKIQVKGTSTAPIVNIANLDCVCIEIAYKIIGVDNIIYTTMIERNLKFDTNLSNFGEIDNLIFSKVNENENMLKLKHTKKDRSFFPMIDEFGLTWDKRFIFKSTWDSDYYIRTKKDIE